MEIIKSLAGTTFDVMFEAFSEAFKDYEMQVNKEELYTMIHRRGFNPELSFAAFEGDKIIAFTFNGIGTYNGKATAYDTGTGTIEEYRGRGLAAKIFNYSVPYLKQAGIKQYLLEVLQHNPGAVSLYKKVGFEVSREFNYFVCKTEEVKLQHKMLSADLQIKQIDLSLKDEMRGFRDFKPAWQNNFAAIAGKPEDFIMLGAFKAQVLLGYCIFDPHTGDITQIAVHAKARRQGIATNLLKEALKSNQHSNVKCINTEISCESITKFLQSNGFPLSGKQFEMTKQL